MTPYKETLILAGQPFPVDIFIQDNMHLSVIVEPHWHDCVEILYMLSGTSDQYLNDHWFKMNSGDILVINHGDIHATRCTQGENTNILVIKFLPEFVNVMENNLFESKYFTTFLNTVNPKDSLGNQLLEKKNSCKNITGKYSEKLVLEIYKEFTEKTLAYEISIKGCIYQLIALLAREGLINLTVPQVNKDQGTHLDLLLTYIEKNYSQQINLNTASEMLRFSYHYTSRFFKKVTGKNFNEYLNFVRICEAEKLILSTEMTISAIAYGVGFSSTSVFNRIFHRIRGYSPKKLKQTKIANN